MTTRRILIDPIDVLLESFEQFEDLRRFAGLLPRDKDIELLVLKSHLLYEELLRTFIDRRLASPASFVHREFTFDQCLLVAKSLRKSDQWNWVWSGVKKLNGIRNTLAHNLEPKGFEDKIDDFIRFVEDNEKMDFHSHQLKGLRDKQLVMAMSVLYGSLSSMNNVL